MLGSARQKMAAAIAAKKGGSTPLGSNLSPSTSSSSNLGMGSMNVASPSSPSPFPSAQPKGLAKLISTPLGK